MRTYVLGASALFAFLRDRPGASTVDEFLRETMRGRARTLISTVNYGEVYGLILREFGPERARSVMQSVKPLGIEVIDATPQRACQAFDTKFAYKLYYADSFAAALAIEFKASLVTSDSDFRRLGRGVPVVRLKN